MNEKPTWKNSISRFDNANGGYTGVIFFLIVCLNYFSVRNGFEKNVSPQKAQSYTHKKPSLSASIRKCITDFKQSFSNKFLEISLVMYSKNH